MSNITEENSIIINPETPDELVDIVARTSPDDSDTLQTIESYIKRLGESAQNSINKHCDMLNDDLNIDDGSFVGDSHSNDEKQTSRQELTGCSSRVAKDLNDLHQKLEEVHPSSQASLGKRLRHQISSIPYIGRKDEQLKNRFQSAKPVLNSVSKSLHEGRKQLERDNKVYKSEYENVYSLDVYIADIVSFMKEFYNQLSSFMEENETYNEFQRRILQQRVVYPTLQKIQDLEQQRAVAQQAMITFQVLANNNEELINGVNRTINVAMLAIRIGAILQSGLHNQKRIHHVTDIVSKTGSHYMSENSRKVKEQGSIIHNDASSLSLNIDELQNAWDNLNDAVTELASYREEAIKNLNEQIKQLEYMRDQKSQETQPTTFLSDREKLIGS